MADPSIAKIEIVENGLKIKGLKPGTTQLYVWKKDKLFTFIINTQNYNKTSQAQFIRSKDVNNKDKKDSKASLSLQSGFYSNNNSNSESLSNNLSYEVKINDENSLAFNTNTNLNLFNLSNFERVQLQNINLELKNKLFNLELGDINYFNSLSDINKFNSTLKGTKLSLQTNKNYFNFISGINETPIVFYDKNNPYQEKKEVISGVFDSYSFSEELELKTSLFSMFELENFSKNRFNFSTGLSYKPTKNFYANTNIGTNFNSIAFLGNTGYRYNWEKKNEWIEVFGQYRSIDKNYFLENTPYSNSFSLGFKSQHVSDIKINGSFNINNTGDLYYQKNSFLRMERFFLDKKFKLFSTILYQENKNNTHKGLEIGTNIYYPINSNIIYRYSLNEQNNNNININEIQTSILFSKIFNFNFYLQGLVRSLNSNYLDDKRYDSNISVASEYRISRNNSLGLSLGYNNQYSEKDKKINDYLRTSVITNFSLFSHNFNLSFNFYNALNGDKNGNNMNALFGYSYNNNENQQIYKGEIQGIVFEDLNNNGIFDNNEKIIPNISILAEQNKILSTKEGYNFKDIDYGIYNIFIDKSTLPLGYQITTEKSKKIELNGIIKDINFGIQKQNIIKGTIFGDKKEIKTIGNVKIILDDKNEVYSDVSGTFMFKVSPEKHTLKIDFSTIPQNYRIVGSFVKEIDSNNPEQELFFYLQPIISIEGKLIDFSENKIYTKSIKEHEIKIKTIEKINDQFEISEKTITTDSEGKFYLFDLYESEIEISSKLIKEPIKITIPSKPNEFKIDIPINSK